MQISANVAISSFSDQIAGAKKATAKALSNALTWTAYDAQPELKKEMSDVFDNPRPWTLNSTYVKKARVRNPVAVVGIKDKKTAASVGAASYLRWQVGGGNRRHTRFERALQASRILPRNFHAVIAHGAKRNKHGNIPNRRVRQILADVKEGRAGGYSVVNGYFVMKGDKSQRGRPLGIWQRTTRGKKAKIVPVYTFTPRALGYEKRFNFYGVVKQVMAFQFHRKYDRALRREMARLK